MACQGRNLLHFRVFPDIYFIVRVAVGTHYFVQGLTEHQIADLRADINGVEGGSSEGVSESDSSVGSAST